MTCKTFLKMGNDRHIFPKLRIKSHVLSEFLLQGEFSGQRASWCLSASLHFITGWRTAALWSRYLCLYPPADVPLLMGCGVCLSSVPCLFKLLARLRRRREGLTWAPHLKTASPTAWSSRPPPPSCSATLTAAGRSSAAAPHPRWLPANFCLFDGWHQVVLNAVITKVHDVIGTLTAALNILL